MKNMILQVRNFKNILLLLLIGAVSTAYAWTDCGTNIRYDIQGSTLVLNSPDPTQPATIVSEAFKNNMEITSVTLPENVTTIEGQAFMGCTALTDLDLGSVQQISPYAFDSCTSLNNVVIPPTVTNIGVHAFYACTALQHVLCRPYYAPSLGTDGFTDCHADLKICVPALGTYRYQTNWNSYYENTVLTDCQFLDESDEQSNTEAKINYYRSTSLNSVTLFRTLRKAGCFNTLTLPFSVPDINASPLRGDNVEVYTFTDAAVENGTLVFDITKVNTNRLEAGTPYLIQWDNTGEVITRMDFTDIDGWDDDNTAETTNGTGVTYHGFYGKTHIGDATDGGQHLNLFLGGGNELFWPTDGDDENAKMLGFRAWFQITNSGPSYSPVRRGMPAALRIVATPTGIDSPFPSGEGRGEAATIVLRNGQLVIIRNGQTFSLNGQKL